MDKEMLLHLLTELVQVLIRQVAVRPRRRVLAENCLVPFEAKAPQPASYVYSAAST